MMVRTEMPKAARSDCQGHSVEIKEFFCHSGFAWNQRWSLKISRLENIFKGSEFWFFFLF